MGKKCNKCNKIKSEKEFSINKSKKDGLSCICKLCHKEYRHLHYIKNKTKVLNQVNEYKIKNGKKTTKTKRWIELKEKFPNISDANIKGGRTFPVLCNFCNKEYYKKKSEIREFNFCSPNCKSKHFSTSNPFDFYTKGVKKRAIKKNIEFDLDEVFLEELMKNQNGLCGITNVPIVIPTRIETKIYETASLDRIDNSIGYIKGNVMWVVLGINYMKNRHSNSDLITLINKIFEYRKK